MFNKPVGVRTMLIAIIAMIVVLFSVAAWTGGSLAAGVAFPLLLVVMVVGPGLCFTAFGLPVWWAWQTVTDPTKGARHGLARAILLAVALLLLANCCAEAAKHNWSSLASTAFLLAMVLYPLLQKKLS